MATTNSLLIGKQIYKILSENENVKKYVGTKVFPIVVESGTKYPFIVFTKTGITTDYTKDGIKSDTVTIDIHCVCTTYLASCELANEVRNALDFHWFKTDDLTIKQTHLQNVAEAYQDDAYVQTLTFQMVIG